MAVDVGFTPLFFKEKHRIIMFLYFVTKKLIAITKEWNFLSTHCGMIAWLKKPKDN